MNGIRITRHLDSDTLHLPELRPLIGRDVEIIVRQRDALAAASEEFGNPPTLEELAARQGVTGPTPVQPIHKWSEEEFDGFDEAAARWRAEGKASGGK